MGDLRLVSYQFVNLFVAGKKDNPVLRINKYSNSDSNEFILNILGDI